MLTISALAEGLQVGYETFRMRKIETKIDDLEEEMERLNGTVDNFRERLISIEKTVEELSNYSRNALRGHAMEFLGQFNAATQSNADAVELLVSSLGATISAITFKGKKKSGNRGVPVYRGFIAGTQALEKIFYSLRKLRELKSLESGKIVTTCVGSQDDMKALGLAIAAFYKILEITGLNVCPYSDNSRDLKTIVVKFEGRHTFKEYLSICSNREHRTEILRENRKNVYILGVNGVGKSSWGNRIAGDDPFEVGNSDHTTMIPQSCDIELANGFRLWDTPGLFDGTEQAGQMQDYMDTMIKINGFCSGVLFIFHGACPANELTVNTLEYAKEKFGDHILENFLAVINDFGQGDEKKASYIQFLDDYGYKVTDRNVIVSSAREDVGKYTPIIRNMLADFKPVLIQHFKNKYEDFINCVGGPRVALKNAHESSRQELRDLLRRGRIEIKRFASDGPRKDLSIRKNELLFRQNSKGYFMRRFGSGNRVILEKRVLLDGSSHFQTKIRAHLSMEYQISSAGIFLNVILGNPNHILIHSTTSTYDYILKDVSAMSHDQIKEEITRIVMSS